MQFYICLQNVYHHPGSGSEFNVFGSTTLLRKTKKNKFVRLSCFKLIAGTFCHKKVIFFNHQKIMFLMPNMAYWISWRKMCPSWNDSFYNYLTVIGNGSKYKIAPFPNYSLSFQFGINLSHTFFLWINSISIICIQAHRWAPKIAFHFWALIAHLLSPNVGA